MEAFEQYIKSLLKNVDCSSEEKDDMYLEFQDHLNELKNEYIRTGKSPDEAIKCAIDDFGSQKVICHEMNKSMSRLKDFISIIFKISWWLYSFAFVILLLRPLAKFRYPTRSISLVPFNTIQSYLGGHVNNLPYQIIRNILGNVILFIPFAFLLPICFGKGKSLKESILYTLFLSILVEIYQFTFRVGILDIDDLMLNVFGGLLGYILYKTMVNWLQRKEKIYLII